MLNSAHSDNAPGSAELLRMAFISLGSNLGEPRDNVLNAMKRMESLSTRPILKSSLWRSSPVECPEGSPMFVNAVVGFEPLPGETPESLLETLQALEKECGRKPKVTLNEPRTLDLDLIVFGREQRSTNRLTLPHPRAHLRRFVLQPLNELAPDLVLPGQASRVRQLLAALDTDEQLERLE